MGLAPITVEQLEQETTKLELADGTAVLGEPGRQLQQRPDGDGVVNRWSPDLSTAVIGKRVCNTTSRTRWSEDSPALSAW